MFSIKQKLIFISIRLYITGLRIFAINRFLDIYIKNHRLSNRLTVFFGKKAEKLQIHFSNLEEQVISLLALLFYLQ